MTKRRKTTQRIALAGAALLSLGLAASGWCPLGGCESAVAATPAGRALPVPAFEVQEVPGYSLRRSYTGVLRPRREAELGFEVTGRVASFLVREGETVEAGAPLARLETERLEARRAELVAVRRAEQARLERLLAGPRPEVIEAARASVRELEEQHRLAESQRDRRRPLVESGAVAGDQLDEMTAAASALDARVAASRSRLAELVAGSREEDVTAQRAAVESLDARLNAIDVELSDSTLVAPFAGRVAARHLDEGAVVAMGQPALRLVESQRLEAWVGLPVDVLAQLDDSSPMLSVGARRLETEGTRVLPEVDEGTRTATVIVELSRADSLALRSGEVVRLLVERHVPTPGVWLPTAALTESTRGLWSAFVIESTGEGVGRARQARVEVLHVDGERVFARGTLQGGDLVVAGGAQRLVAGQLVEPRPALIAAAPASALVSID